MVIINTDHTPAACKHSLTHKTEEVLLVSTAYQECVLVTGLDLPIVTEPLAKCATLACSTSEVLMVSNGHLWSISLVHNYQ
jgi:hypothetical protein